MPPFAAFLKERANKDVFENVWCKIEKNGFSLKVFRLSSSLTRMLQRLKRTRNLEPVLIYMIIYANKLKNESFDIALIAAGGLGIPLAAFVKSIGCVGISLGGHLQVIFGVAGRRWKNDPYYLEHYINDFWIDMPPAYHPQNKELLTDSGAYW